MKRRDLIALGGSLAVAAVGTRPAAAEATTVISPIAPPPSGPISVAFVIGPGATVIDVAGPWQVFQSVMLANKYEPPNGDMPADGEKIVSPFKLFMVSGERTPTRASGGMILQPDYTFEDAPRAQVIVVGAQGDRVEKKLDWIKAASQHADITMSVCTGADLLASARLLDGQRATTHHDFSDFFASRFPKVQWVRGPRYVEAEGGRIATSGGESSGIDLALRVVERYFGSDSARRTALQLEYNRDSVRPS